MSVVAGVPLIIKSWPASGNLSTKQFYFVELAAGVITVCNAATDVPLGVLQNKPLDGQQAEVLALGPSKVCADGAITAGALIGTSADGQAAAKTIGTDTTHYVCGRAYDTAANAGEIIEAVINCVSPFRAA